jgi:hypothetical protein
VICWLGQRARPRRRHIRYLDTAIPFLRYYWIHELCVRPILLEGQQCVRACVHCIAVTYTSVEGKLPVCMPPHVSQLIPSIGATAPRGPRPFHCLGFTITLRHTTLCRTPLDEWSARRRDLCLITHNTHYRQTSMPPAGFQPVIPASERPQSHALDGAVTGFSSLTDNA